MRLFHVGDSADDLEKMTMMIILMMMTMMMMMTIRRTMMMTMMTNESNLSVFCSSVLILGHFLSSLLHHRHLG